jgi:hypothetical protein
MLQGIKQEHFQMYILPYGSMMEIYRILRFHATDIQSQVLEQIKKTKIKTD